MKASRLESNSNFVLKSSEHLTKTQTQRINDDVEHKSHSLKQYDDYKLCDLATTIYLMNGSKFWLLIDYQSGSLHSSSFKISLGAKYGSKKMIWITKQ